MKCNNRTLKRRMERHECMFFVLKRNLFVIAKTEVKQVNRNASPKKIVEMLVNTTK